MILLLLLFLGIAMALAVGSVIAMGVIVFFTAFGLVYLGVWVREKYFAKYPDSKLRRKIKPEDTRSPEESYKEKTKLAQKVTLLALLSVTTIVLLANTVGLK